MASTTSNIGLTKPAGTDKALVSVINSNSDIIDSAAGGLMDAIAIVANGNTHAAISAGQYVYVHNHGTLAEGLYTANSAIAANATLSTSNLTADASGGLNALNSNIINLQEGKFGNIQQVSGVAVNTLRDSGFYYLSNCTGLPYGSYGYLQVYKRLDGYVKQIFQPIDLNRIYTNTYYNSNWVGWEEYALNSSIFISGTIGSRLALLDTTGDSYTIPATGMYKLSFSGTGGQIKMNGNVLFDNNVAVQFAVPFKQGASLSWTKAGGTCSIYRVS